MKNGKKTFIIITIIGRFQKIKMKKLVCYINSANYNVNFKNFSETVDSISKNINIDFDFYVVTDRLEHKNKFHEIFDLLQIYNILDIEVKDDIWSNNFNNFFDKYKNDYDYLLVSHDDLVVRTYDFFNICYEQIKEHEDNIGWIGFTSDSYYRLSNRLIHQSAREFFCIDRNHKNLFELNKMQDVYDEKLLDLPKKACKVPGIFSHFNMIKFKNLEKIGPCATFGEYTLLIDEDWSIRTLINNLWTVWVPNIFYDHPLRYDDRIVKDIRNCSEGERLFSEKWDYNPSFISNETIKKVCSKFPNTNIDFFNDKYTFDYQYLD